MKPIFLIGFMASGKTTLGRALADAIPGISFIDLDDEIRLAAGMSVPEIFKSRGEAGFRALESETLRAVGNDNSIIACGGGTPCRRENMDYMLRHGTVVRLEADIRTIVRRIIEAGPGRPVIDAFLDNPDALYEKVEELIEQRRPHYSLAPFSFDANRLETPGQIAESTERFIKDFIR